jgi:hypothetical protein
MGELSEDAKKLLGKVLRMGRVAYDSLNDSERRAAEELIKLGYVKVYLEPNAKRIGDALRVIGSGDVRHAVINYACLAIVATLASVFLVLLYLAIRAFILKYALVGVFLLFIDFVMVYIAYLLIRRYGSRCLRAIKLLLS